MPNVNYIASAGTGKTYSLVSEVLKKILNEDVSLKQMLILTFSEKTAVELKEKISERIKENIKNPELKTEEKRKLHRELIFIDSGYIGTFHSVFLRLLRKYPHVSNIDNSFSVIASSLENFLSSSFEKWIEKDFEENKSQWIEIIQIFGSKHQKVKNTFFKLYENRLKLVKPEIDLQKQKEKVEALRKELNNLLDTLFEEYPFLFDKEQVEKFFRVSPFDIRTYLKENRFTDLKTDDRKPLFLFKRSRKLSEEEKDFFENYLKKVIEDEDFKELDRQIYETSVNLKVEALDYNANLILTRFFDFLSFLEEEKRKEKVIDFNDILEKTVKLVEKEDIRSQIRKNFKYIFVDEFQDTDIIQNKILEAISDNNMYVFGDPKQCIYTWRDANLDLYYQFLEKNNFEDVVLEKNYRSTKTLIEFYNSLLSGEQFLSHIDKKYKTPLKHYNPEEKGYVKLVELKSEDTKEAEALYTVYLVKKLIEEGHQLKDIMILFRRNKDIHFFKNILTKYNIPVVATSDTNLFEQQEVKTVIDILRLIENPERQITLLKVLKSPLFFIPDLELYRNKGRFSLDSFQGKNITTIKKLIQKKYSLTVEEILDILYKETDLLETVSLLPEGKRKIKNLNKLKTLAKKRTIEGLSLRDFILYTETSFEPEENLYEDENAVLLLTMHKSKGLESPVVIIPLISKEPDRIKLNNVHIKDGKPLLNIDKAVSKQIHEERENLKQDIKNENERLFYVAITRAREKLIFISGGKAKENSYRKILNENLIQIEQEDIKQLDIKPLETKKEEYIDIEKIFRQLEEEEKTREDLYKKAINEKRFVSVSKLLEEKHKEEEKNLNFSEKKEENLSLYTGIVVHSILEQLDFKDFSIDKVLKVLEKEKKTIPENLIEPVEKNVISIFKTFENSPLHKELKKAEILFRELPFTLYEDGRYIEGRIDVIYKKDNQIVVMDYKTNRYTTEEEKKKILKAYEKQKEYYLKAVKKIFPEKEIVFRLGLLWKGELY